MRRGVIGIDVTVMSSKGPAKNLAPTWELVMGHKNGTLSDDDYAYAYGALLRMVPDAAWKWLQSQANEEENITLLCYCKDGKFCHTHMIGLFAESVLPDEFTCNTHPPESILSTKWYQELAECGKN